MSRYETVLRFRHVLDHAREAVAMAARKARKDLGSDRKLNLALVRLPEVVGEAATFCGDRPRSLCLTPAMPSRRVSN